MSPMRSSKFSRHQEVSVTAATNSNSLWTFDTVDPKQRFDSMGKPVNMDETVLLRHIPTAQWLAGDNVKYVNDFGVEF